MYESIPVTTAFQSTINCNPLFSAVIVGSKKTSSIIDQFPYDHDTAGPNKLFRFRHLLNFEYV